VLDEEPRRDHPRRAVGSTAPADLVTAPAHLVTAAVHPVTAPASGHHRHRGRGRA
jgi:hypothetical protein